ncbi:MAG: Sensory transduction histidine kinase [uncultured Sulfurovum sp.]|uniref:histidine kinase n=1 Tax=uncultured Sulfurovum sp. TaxID=269237 RepID=A0A6S6TNM2_9BACT|nr:MAG: Sensory transduction histidine kinase [uncultured Sulfurovum sp.]
MLSNYVKNLKSYVLLLLLISIQLNALSSIEVSKEGSLSVLEHSSLHIESEKLDIHQIIEHDYLKEYSYRHFDIGISQKDTVWIGFELSNNTNQTIEKALVLSSPLLEKIELYHENNLTNPRLRGVSYPQPDHSTLSYYYNIQLNAKSSVKYYMKVYAHYVPLNFSIYLTDEAQFKKADGYRQLINSLLMGIVLALILYSFILYFYTNDKSYLFYSLYLFMLTYQQFTYLGLTQIYFQDFARLDIELTVLKLGGLMLTSAFFAISFLRIRKVKKLYRVYKVFIAIILLESLVMSFPTFYNIQIVLVTAILFIILNLFSGIIRYVQGERQSRLYIIGFGTIFMAYFLMILDALGILGVVERFPNIIMYATVIEAFVLLLAFADRYKILQKQKDEMVQQREQIIKNEVIEQTAKLNQALKSKELLIKEIHHRVKNNLQIILSMIRLQNDKITDKSISEQFLNLESRINAIAKTYTMLLIDGNIEHLDMEEYIESLVEDIDEAMCINCDITIQTNIEGTLPLNKSVYVGIIINEIVTNAYKYAFTNGQGHIYISLKQTKNAYVLIVGDNGKGFVPNLQSHTLGLKLINALVLEQLKGEMTMQTKNSTQYTIRFTL